VVTVHSGQYPPDGVPAVTTDPTLTLRGQIAAGLGGGWHASRSDWMVLIGHPDGRQLHLSRPDRLPGRVVAAGMYPSSDYHFRSGDRHQITVRVDRGPTVIAAEIRPPAAARLSADPDPGP
jgi:hypothetical protein